jgi:hypothetical protein
MTDEMLRSGEVQNISTLITDREFPEKTRVLLEKLPEQVIPPSNRQNLLCMVEFDPTFELISKLDFDHATSGRIFHPDFELRWDRSNGKTQVVYLGNDEPKMLSLVNNHNSLLMQCSERKKYYYLFGERLSSDQVKRIGGPADDGDFAVLRIPRLLRYKTAPPGAQRVWLVVREYVHPQTGQLLIFRFEDLVPGE